MATTERLPRAVNNEEMGIAGVGVLIAGVIILAGNWDVQPGENGGTGPAIVTAIASVVLAVALFGWVVPRARNLDRTALILGIIALVLVVAFWSGLTPVLAAAAYAVYRRSDAPGRNALIGVVLGAIATIACLAITLPQSHLF